MISARPGSAPVGRSAPARASWLSPLTGGDLLGVAAVTVVLFAIALWQANLDLVVVTAYAIGAASLVGIASEWRRGRVLSLEFVMYALALTSFCIRPLYLWSLRTQLQSHEFPPSVDAQLENLTSLELAYVVTNRLPGGLDGAFLTALLVGGAFFATFALGRWLARNWGPGTPPRLLRRAPAPTMARLIGAFLAVGLGVQLAGLVGIGGAVLSPGSFEGAILARFAVVGLLLWAAYGPLRGPAGLAFVGFVLAFVVLRSTGGSRTEALLPVLAIVVVIHMARRPFRPREVLAMAVCGVMLANFVLTARTVVLRQDRPIAEAISQGLGKATSLKVAQGDNSQFDDFLIMTMLVPERFPHAHGERLAAGVASSVPSLVLPAKPEQNEQTFRKLAWGDLYDAGRPYTIPGEFWFDFGWIGVLVGGLGLGALAARIRGLGQPLARGVDPGAAVLSGVLIPLAFVGMGGTYTILFTAAQTFAVPLLVAAWVMRRANRRATGHAWP